VVVTKVDVCEVWAFLTVKASFDEINAQFIFGYFIRGIKKLYRS
jgi:hypothetical protein